MRSTQDHPPDQRANATAPDRPRRHLMVTRAQQQLLAAGAMTETGRHGLDDNIKDYADQLRLIAIHTPDSRRVTGKGWPDWVLLGSRGTLFVEGKSRGKKRSPAQIEV